MSETGNGFPPEVTGQVPPAGADRPETANMTPEEAAYHDVLLQAQWDRVAANQENPGAFQGSLDKLNRLLAKSGDAPMSPEDARNVINNRPLSPVESSATNSGSVLQPEQVLSTEPAEAMAMESPSLGAANPSEMAEADQPASSTIAPDVRRPRGVRGARPRVSAEERQAAQAKYDTLYAQLDQMTRDGKRRDGPEMQPLLTEFEQAKRILATPVRRARAPRAARVPTPSAEPVGTAAVRPDVLSTEPAVVETDSSIPAAPEASPINAPTETPLEMPPLVHGTIEPGVASAAAQAAAETPASPFNTMKADLGAIGADASAPNQTETAEQPSAPAAAETATPATESAAPKPDTESFAYVLPDEGTAPKTEAGQPATPTPDSGPRPLTEDDLLERIGAAGTPEPAKASSVEPRTTEDGMRRDIRSLQERIEATDDENTILQLQAQKSALESRLIDGGVASATSSERRTTPDVTVLDAAAEKTAEKKETPMTAEEIALVDARTEYAKALKKERRWLNIGNKRDLTKATTAYQEALSVFKKTKIIELNAEFAGRDMKNETVQAEYAKCMADVALVRMTEQAELGTSLMESGQKDWLEQTRVKLRNNGGKRFVASALLGSVGAGQIISAASWGLAIEGAARGIGKWAGRKWGASKMLTAEEVGQINDLGDLERRLAAHTMDMVEYGELKDARKGSKKHKESTADAASEKSRAGMLNLLHERIGELHRGQREKEVTEMLKGGRSLEEVANEFLKSSLVDHERIHDATLSRIKRNKFASMARVSASAAGGILVGSTVNIGMKHVMESAPVQNTLHGVGDWMNSVLHHGAGDQAKHAGSALGDAYRGATDGAHGPATEQAANGPHKDWADLRMEDDQAMRHKDWADLRMQEDGYEAAKEAARVAGHVETVGPGEGLWHVADRFVKEAYPHLTTEQRTWMVDSIKDKAVAHPELLGLHDLNLQPGQQIDLSKLGIDYRVLGDKAGHLSESVTSSIHENLTHHAAAAGTHVDVPTVDIAHLTPPETSLPTAEPGDIDQAISAATEQAATTVAPEHVTTAASEQISQRIPEAIKATPEMSKIFESFQMTWINMPNESMRPLLNSFQGVTLEQASQVGQIERLIGGVQGVPDAQRELTITSLHKVAESLIKNGHSANESLAAGLEWLRMHR